MKKEDSEEIVARLDVILRLMLDFQRKTEGLKLGDQILVLQDAGLSLTDSGRILGIEVNQIPSYLRSAENQKLAKKLKKKGKTA
ncbi:MAG: hypothetical protein ACYC7D_10010 [Nitrososphaerales archaeon]